MSVVSYICLHSVCTVTAACISTLAGSGKITECFIVLESAGIFFVSKMWEP